MANVYLVEIDQQPIELYKLLKLADLVSGGGEAKVVISEGYVLLNNEVEFQKRKKVYDGDYIQFGDNIIEVSFVPNEQTSDASLEVESLEAGSTEQAYVEPVNTTPKKRTSPNKSKKTDKNQTANKSKSKSQNKKNTAKQNTTNNKANNDKSSGKRRAISF